MKPAGEQRRADKRLILFDIDGTLLWAGPQVKPAFAGALAEVLGTEGDLEGYDFAGKTDEQAVVELMSEAGVEPERVRAAIPDVRSRYVERLDRELEAGRMRLLPGVLELLDALAARDGVCLGLLTGNWERGARVKLGRLGLAGYFRFGAFGDGEVDRRRLPPVALDRARRVAGRGFSAAETLVVGDTGRDVDCAHAHGIEALAVATGSVSAADLESAGADWIYDDLRAVLADPGSPLVERPAVSAAGGVAAAARLGAAGGRP